MSNSYCNLLQPVYQVTDFISCPSPLQNGFLFLNYLHSLNEAMWEMRTVLNWRFSFPHTTIKPRSSALQYESERKSNPHVDRIFLLGITLQVLQIWIWSSRFLAGDARGPETHKVVFNCLKSIFEIHQHFLTWNTLKRWVSQRRYSQNLRDYHEIEDSASSLETRYN